VTFDGATYYNVNVMAGAWQIDTNSVVPSSGSLTGGFTNGLSYGVVARVDDAAGNSVFDSSIDEVFYETTPPTVQIFGDGSTGVITFNFSEAPVNFDASDISVVNGTKGALTMVNATTYELAVTPAFAETATNIAITVGAGTFRDEAGNWNSAAAKNATTIANSFQSPTFATNITNLDVSHAISAESAFANNNTFNQDIGGWDISSLTDASGFLDGAVGMAVANLDKLLAGWSDLNLSSGETAIQNNVALGLSGKTYTDAASAQYLIDNYGWTLTGSIAAGTVVGGNTIDDSFNQNAAVSGTVMHGLGGNDYLAGSDHADTIVGGAGDDILRGNGGSDTFRYHFTNEGVDTILDFDLTQAPSAGGDVLNVHYLLDGATNLNIGDFIQLVDNGGNVLRFDIDADGNASGADVSIIFDNIAFSDVTGPHLAFLQDMITQQNLVI
jgi:Ca2+-binding RTX toxin-like protein